VTDARLERLGDALRGGDLAWARLADGTAVIVDARGQHVLTLNETGLLVVDALRDGVASEEVLAARLVEAYEAEPAVAASDVRAFLERLQRAFEGTAG
jgi:hypothetical protein